MKAPLIEALIKALVKADRRVLYMAAIACLLPALAMAPSGALAADSGEFQELRKMVQELKSKLDKAEQRLEEMSRDVSGNTQAVEAASAAIESAEGKPSVFDNMAIGGYGELHYNNLDADNSAHDKDELDFHRFVLFFGYEYSDNLRFFSEVELEHALAGEDKPGEVELEQAFVEYDFDARNTGRAGVFLLPVGIMNETHEPPTFYGVERNPVENVIIPATWWAGGVGFTHRADNGITLDLALHEGLEIDPGDSTAREINCATSISTPPTANVCTGTEVTTPNSGEVRIRGGRQKTANARADDLAWTGRIKYTGLPGLELAATVQYQSDLAQDHERGAANDVKDAWLYETHAAFNRGPFGLRALYARWDIDADGAAEEYDEQDGWYLEPSWKFGESFGVFARYSDVDGGRSRDRFDQWTLGFNYWLNEDTVLKADYQERDHDNTGDEGRDFDGFNLGVGYQF